MTRIAKALIIATIALIPCVVQAEEFVVGNFDSGTNPVNWKPAANTYGSAGGGASGDAAFDAAVRHGTSGSSLRITWSGVDGVGKYGGGVITDSVTVSDLSGFDALSFWIFTPNVDTDVSIGIMTTDYITGYAQLQEYLVTGTSVWQNVIIPIGALKRNNTDLDLTRIKEIKWLAENGDDASGIIYVDDVSLCNLRHAPAGTKIYTGGDKGHAYEADIPGDTVVTWDGAYQSLTTDELSIEVSTGYSVSWVSVPDNVSNLIKNTTTYFSYQFINNGNKADSIAVSSLTIAGQELPTTLYIDNDRSGTYTDGDAAHPLSADLVPDSTHYFLVGIYMPDTATLGFSTGKRITAKDKAGAGSNDSWPTGADDDTITDEFVYAYSGTSISVIKSSDTASAAPADIITYTITYANSGDLPANHVMITEVLPFNTTFDTEVSAVHDPDVAVQYFVDGAWQDGASAAATKIRWIDTSLAASGTASVSYKVRVR